MTKRISNTTKEIIKNINEPIKENVNKFLSTGATLLDLVLGGGAGEGKVINIVGDKSSGKTILAIEFLAAARKRLRSKLKWFYDDCESGFSFDEMSLFNFKILREEQKNSETIEEAKYNLEKELDQLKKDEYLIYVIDSLDGLSCEAEMEREKEEKKAREKGKRLEKGTYGTDKQKYLKKMFRLLAGTIKEKKCTLVVISQVITNIGVMFGRKFTRSGGKGLDFYASQIIWLSEVEKMKRLERVIGIRIKIKNEKNKLAPPFRECFLDILFDYGIDNVASNINYLYDMLTPTGKYSAKKIQYKDEEITPAGLIKKIEKENLEEWLENEVILKWNNIERKISSEGRKKKYK